MEGHEQEFGVEVRGGQVSATEWQLIYTSRSLECAKSERDMWGCISGHEARIVTRHVTPWRKFEEGS